MTQAAQQKAIEIRPQPGPQEAFLSSPADIVIYGGSAGSGKTWAELLEPLRHISTVKGFGAVIFRRTSPQIRNEGGLWDESAKLYPLIGATPKEQDLRWVFPPFGNKVKFMHLEYDKDAYNHQGAQYPLIEFDELTHFSKHQFFYLLGRNRSTCGVRPYLRATTNPDPDSWVREFIDWWIGPDGLPIIERSGVIRCFVRISDEIIWADTKKELIDRFPEEEFEEDDIMSVTFIAATIYDNPALLRADPGYLAKLKALPRVERERLLGGNWDVRANVGEVFRRSDFEIVDAAPVDVVKRVRAWDLAASKGKGDWTAGVAISKGRDGIWYIEDVERGQWSPSEVRKRIKNTASLDGAETHIRLPQDPGQAGKAQAQSLIAMLAGYVVKATPVTGSKLTRAQPLAAQVEAGNVKIVRGPWNKDFLNELENFDGTDGCTDDQVDAASDAFNELDGKAERRPQIRAL